MKKKQKKRATKAVAIVATKALAIRRRRPLPTPKTPQELMALALRSKASVEIVERVSALADRWKKDLARDTFFRELTMLQQECPPIAKARKVYNTKGENRGKVRYVYAPYEYIKKIVQPFMTQHGFSHTVKPKQTATRIGATVVLHHVQGHEEESTFMVPIDKDAYMNDQQKVGAALSFATRYAFKDVLGLTLVGEDTDANTEDDSPPPKQDKPADLQRPQEKAAGADQVEVMYTQIAQVLKDSPLSPEAKRPWQESADRLRKSKNSTALAALLNTVRASEQRLKRSTK